MMQSLGFTGSLPVWNLISQWTSKISKYFFADWLSNVHFKNQENIYDINILFYKSSELNSREREYCFLMSDHEDRLYLLQQHTQRCHSSLEGLCSET